MEHPETVKVKDPSGTNPFILINKSDFNEDDYELLDPPAPKLSVDEIKKELMTRKVEFSPTASKKELLALLNANPAQ